MRYFGVEIETMVARTDGAPTPPRGWSARGDGSLHAGRSTYGSEFVSERLRGATGIERLFAMVDCLSACGCHENASTGLHVHVDAAHLTLAHVQMAKHLFRTYEYAFYGASGARIFRRMAMATASPNGRHNYCKTTHYWGGGFGDRYRGLNTSNWREGEMTRTKNTLELRCFSPRIDRTHILAAVTLAHALVAYAAEHPLVGPPPDLLSVERLFGPDRAMAACLAQIALPDYLPDPEYDYRAVFAYLTAQAEAATARIAAAS